jgi:hypothetical protein
VLTVPDNFADSYRLPALVLDSIREAVSGSLPVRMPGPSKVARYEYGTLVLESCRDEPVTVEVIADSPVQALKNLKSGGLVQKQAAPVEPRGPAPAGPPPARFTVRPPPHSFMGLSLH